MPDVTDKIGTGLSQIGTLLRYIAPGFVATFALAIVSNEFNQFLIYINCIYQIWALVIGSAITGFLIYALHTIIFGRIGFWLVVMIHRCNNCSLISKSDRKKTPCKIMFDLDIERWMRRADNVTKEVKAIQNELNKWGALQSFLYCSSYTMILFPLLALLFIGISNLKSCWFYPLIVGFVLLIFSLISDYRITNREFWVVNKYPQREIKSGTKSET
ncbi:MAG: hypothetical protein ACTSUC_12135 [Promethearchaeota archaeon]